jgi:hypothetical protein
VYSLKSGNVEAGANATNVVTGIIPLFGSVACILFDSGATHSFISSNYMEMCKLSTEPLDQNICVATSVGDAITCWKCVDNCPIVIEGKTLPPKLAIFSMLIIDVIFGNGLAIKVWSKHRLPQEEGDIPTSWPRRIQVLRVQSTSPFLSNVQAIKSVREGAQAYLAYVQAKPEVKLKLEDILIVYNYLDVFSEVTGLPPDRKIEFTVYLVPGTQPIHKAPYSKAPTKLRELKEQLQELLDQGFIRPSVSPWGALVLFVKKKDDSMRMCIDYRY